MSVRPKLSDLPAVNVKFHDGDRVLVRVSCNLSSDQVKSIERAVKKFACAEVRIIIVNCLFLQITCVRSDGTELSLCSPEDACAKGIDLGVASLDCSIVDLHAGDVVSVRTLGWHLDQLQRQRAHEWIQRWAGDEVEVRVSV